MCRGKDHGGKRCPMSAGAKEKANRRRRQNYAVSRIIKAAAAEQGINLQGSTVPECKQWLQEHGDKETQAKVAALNDDFAKARWTSVVPEEEAALANVIKETTAMSTAKTIATDRVGVASTNVCMRTELEDGSICYFKADNAVSLEALREYGVSSAGLVRHEVAAYKMAQALGPGFDHMVPETTVRLEGGKIGSAQREVYGRMIDDDHIVDVVGNGDEYRRAKILDYVLGSQDRNGGNVIISATGKTYMIDNGYSFPSSTYDGINESVFDGTESESLTDDDKKTLQELADSPDLKGVGKYLTENEQKETRKRIMGLLEKGTTLLVMRDYFEERYPRPKIHTPVKV